jgi:hypothetical protein
MNLPNRQGMPEALASFPPIVADFVIQIDD